MKKLSLLLMLGTVLNPWSANATDCVATPDCASLGYTMDASKCSGAALKCPWDTSKAACKEKEALKSQLPILYGDGTVSKNIVSGTMPIGIVYDEANKLAVALSDIDKDGRVTSRTMAWGEGYLGKTGGLCTFTAEKDCETLNESGNYCAPDSQKNTQSILSTTQIITDGYGTKYTCKDYPYAAIGSQNYTPSGCSKEFCSKTKWFVPSMQELQKIYSQKDTINSVFNSLRLGNKLQSGVYCSSNTSSSYKIWTLDFTQGIQNKILQNVNCYLRPVIYYGEPKVSPTAELPLLYGDGTVSKEILSGKTPIGVVFDTANRLAVALTDVKKDGTAGSERMQWSSSYCDTPGLQICTAAEIPYQKLTPITCGVDGRLNTNAILASSCNGTTYAATATNNYQPTGCTKDFCKKSKWFLPSFRDLQNIYLQKTQIDASLTLLKGYSATTVKNEYYWSSTEGSEVSVWLFSMLTGGRSNGGKYENNYSVRPVIAY